MFKDLNQNKNKILRIIGYYVVGTALLSTLILTGLHNLNNYLDEPRVKRTINYALTNILIANKFKEQENIFAYDNMLRQTKDALINGVSNIDSTEFVSLKELSDVYVIQSKWKDSLELIVNKIDSLERN